VQMATMSNDKATDRVEASVDVSIDSNIDWGSEVARLLDELSTVQGELLDVLSQKCDRMAVGDTDGMAKVQEQEVLLVERLEKCRSRREKLLSLAGEHGLPSVSIRQLASAIPDGQKELKQQVTKADAKTQLLRHQSITNWVVTQQTLLHLSQMLEVIAGGGQLRPTYGTETSAHGHGSLVDEAA